MTIVIRIYSPVEKMKAQKQIHGYRDIKFVKMCYGRAVRKDGHLNKWCWESLGVCESEKSTTSYIVDLK